jgi:2-aminoadipate transaminase
VAARYGVAPRRVVLTVGGLQGFVFYAAEQLARAPGRVLVEAPSYDRPLKILAREGVEIVALDLDEQGLDPDALAAELESRSDRPSFLYMIPTFQNPSGRTLSAERRARLVEVVREHGLAVLEDDPYGLVRFEGDPEASLFELEGGDLVTYTSSFSKTVAPGVRSGYFVLPDAQAAAFEERAVSTYISPPFLPQAVVAEFIARGHFDPNLAHVRSELQARRDAMLTALDANAPGGVSWSHPAGATSSGSSSTAQTPVRSLPTRSGRVSRSSPAPASSRPAQAGARRARASPTATRRPSGSPRASSA